MSLELPNDTDYLIHLLQSAINDISEPDTLSNVGTKIIGLGKYKLHVHYDNNDKVNFVYIYDMDEDKNNGFVAAFNSFSMAVAFVLTSMVL